MYKEIRQRDQLDEDKQQRIIAVKSITFLENLCPGTRKWANKMRRKLYA